MMLLISDEIVKEMKIPQLYDMEEVESDEKQIYLKYMEAIYTIERDEEFVPVKFKELEL